MTRLPALQALVVVRVIVAVLALAIFGSAGAHAQCYQWIEHASHIPAGNDWGVSALAEHDGALIAVGSFNYMGGQQCRGSARWDGHRWRQLGTNAVWSSYVFSFHSRLCVQGGNGLVELAGDAWIPVPGRTPGRTVTASYERESDIVIVSNSPNQVGFVEAWDGVTWSAYPSLEGAVSDVTEFNGHLVIAGEFTSSGGNPLTRVAVWDGTAWQPMGTGLDAKVHALEVNRGVLYAAGEFVTAGGVPALRVARWDGQTWTQVGAGFSNTVHDLRSSGGKLYAGGAFAFSGAATVRFTAVLGDDDAWVQVGAAPRGKVTTLSGYNGTLVFGGDNPGSMTGVSGLSTGWLDANSRWQSFGMGLGSGAGGYVSKLVSSGGEVFAAGSFNEAGGDVTIARGARWDGERWHEVQPASASTIPTAFFRYGSDILIGTQFMPPGASTVWGPLLQWNGSTWSEVVSAHSGTSNVNSILEWNNEVYIGGNFSVQLAPFPNLPTSNVVRWNGSVLSQLGPGVVGNLTAMTVWDNSLIAAGALVFAGGQPVTGIARWQGQAWSPMGAGINGTTLAVTVFQRELIAAGSFTTAGTHSVSNIARWDGTDWQPLGAGLDGAVYALAEFDGSLIAGGEFMNAGGQTAKRLARWDGNTWQEFNGGASARVRALCVHRGELLVGGDFLQLGGVASVYFGRAKTCCGTADFNWDGDFGTDADIEAFFACLAGNCCEACLNSDFNGDGDFGTDGDIEAFFRVLAGGNC